MKEGRLGYNSDNKRYGLLISDLWERDGFHCGECMEVMVEGEWVPTRIEMDYIEPPEDWKELMERERRGELTPEEIEKIVRRPYQIPTDK